MRDAQPRSPGRPHRLIAGVAGLGFIKPRLAFAGFLVVGITYVLPLQRIVAVARRQPSRL